jgi:hypothetical protein
MNVKDAIQTLDQIEDAVIEDFHRKGVTQPSHEVIRDRTNHIVRIFCTQLLFDAIADASPNIIKERY